MPPTNPYFLNPNAGFTPAQGMSAQPNVSTGQTGSAPQAPRATPYVNPQPYTTGQNQPSQTNQPSGTAVRPTDQNNPQSAWMQNMATFAGGNLAASNALGNQPTGPVRRLVDVLGQNPFGEQNPMTLLMQALQQSNYGQPMPDQTTPPVQSPPIYRPPFYMNPGWGGPGRPSGFNPMQMWPQ